jgi:threonine dehydrogenase-like Zn-dependent dehydrogenase
MKGLMIRAEWAPRKEYELSEAEKRRKIAYRGNMVWKNPTYKIENDIPDPEPGPNSVVIKVAACGVCGSDVHMLWKTDDNYVYYPGECGFPVIPGHEFAGEVVEVGKDVKKIKVGDLVTVEECQWCGECNPCRAGFLNQCVNLDQLGFDYPNNGAMAEYVMADEKFCWVLDDMKRIYNSKDKILEAGSLVEPTAVAYEGIFTIAKGIQSGGNVAIFGTGPIGLGAIQLLKTTGAGTIFAFEPNPFRRELGEKMGADFVHDPGDASIDPAKIVMDFTHGEGVAMGVECAGAYENTIPHMEKMAGVSGKIVLVGMGPALPKIDPMQYHRFGLSLYATLGHSGHGDFWSVINLMANKRIDMLPAITSRYPLEKAAEGILAADNGKNAKVLIKP